MTATGDARFPGRATDTGTSAHLATRLTVAVAAGIGLTATLMLGNALGFISGHHPGVLVLHIPVAVGLFGMLVRQLTSLRQLRHAT